MKKWVIYWDDDPSDVAGTFYNRGDAIAYIWGMTTKWSHFRVEKLPNDVTRFICSDSTILTLEQQVKENEE